MSKYDCLFGLMSAQECKNYVSKLSKPGHFCESLNKPQLIAVR